MSDSVNPGQSTASPRTRRSDAAARAVQALDLRLSGMDYGEIAARLGYKDKSGAWRAVQGELRKARQDRADEVIALDLARTDRLLHAMWGKAIAGDTAAFDRVVKVLERRARYFGLDGRADATSDQLRAAEELAFAKLLVQVAELRNTTKDRLALASIAGAGLASEVSESSPWEEVALRLEVFDDEHNAHDYSE